MAPRAVWKGLLKVNLVHVPVRLYSASEAKSKIAFHELHDACKCRINRQSYCTSCHRTVVAAEIVSGYETAPGQHVVVQDGELAAIADAASAFLTIESVSTEPLDPLYVDGSLYLVPDMGAQQAVETLRLGLGDRLAIGTMVMRRRTVRVALQAADEPAAFYVYRLRASEQLRDVADLSVPALVAPCSPADVDLANSLFTAIEGDFDAGDVTDDYTDRVKALIAAKVAGAPVAVVPTAPQASVLFSAALAQAVDATKATRKAKLPTKAAGGVRKASLPAKVKTAKRRAS
jgi:DNA end-binding protein Ku